MNTEQRSPENIKVHVNLARQHPRKLSGVLFLGCMEVGKYYKIKFILLTLRKSQVSTPCNRSNLA